MGIGIPTYPSPYESVVFFEIYRKDISLICTILGYDSDHIVDDTILGFLCILTSASGVMPPKFNLYNYLAQEIHSQLEDILVIEKFIYPSYFSYMFLYHNFEHYKGLNLKIRDESGN